MIFFTPQKLPRKGGWRFFKGEFQDEGINLNRGIPHCAVGIKTTQPNVFKQAVLPSLKMGPKDFERPLATNSDSPSIFFQQMSLKPSFIMCYKIIKQTQFCPFYGQKWPKQGNFLTFFTKKVCFGIKNMLSVWPPFYLFLEVDLTPSFYSPPPPAFIWAKRVRY